MSNDSRQESPSSRPRFYPSQMQIERLKREDEEEHWISGEELYTEGSSEEEEDMQQRLIIREPDVRSDAENIGSISIQGGSQTESAVLAAGAGHSKLSHPGLPRSAQIPNRSFQLLQKKGKIDEPDCSNKNSVISTRHAALRTEKKLSSSSPSPSSSSSNSVEIIDPEIADNLMASGSCAVEKYEAAAGDNREENIDVDVVDDEEKEISWRPKRDDDYVPNLIFEESIVELRELQFEYHEILDSISELKTSLIIITEPSNFSNYNDSANNTIKTLNNYKNEDNDEENYNVDLIQEEEEEKEEEEEEEETVPIMQKLLQHQHHKIGDESPTAVIGDGIIIIENVSFSDKDVDRWSNTAINRAKMKKEIYKIMKLDRCIEEIDQKVKNEMEQTLKEQISNRKELKRLQILRSAPEAGKLAKNSIRFFKLCSMEIESEAQDIESANCTDLPIYQSQNKPEDFQIPEFELEFEEEEEEEEEEEDEEESRKSRREKLEEQLTIIDKRRASFIERNKKLASCAMGTLAITDEEKKRLEELVRDVDDQDGIELIKIDKIINNSTDSSSSIAYSTPYTIDKEADELLKKLTDQLANINSETYRKSEKKQFEVREEFLPHKEQLVINSLRNLAESGSKIIHPISEEEIRQLINEYYAEAEEAKSSRNYSLNDFSNDSKFEIEEDEKPTSGSMISGNPTIAKELINELVKEAKTAMPLFQFKNRTESIDENLED